MTITDWMQKLHATSRGRGWWDHGVTLPDTVANVHAELSEAWEEYRAGRKLNEIYYEGEEKPCGIPVELADAVIRIFDFCEAFGIDLERVIAEKDAYNQTREYRHGGKIA